MKRANLNTWKSARPKKKNKAASGIVSLKDDRALFARFLVVVLSRPDLDVKETISTYELAEHPRALFTPDGSLRHCVGKSKLMGILESMTPEHQRSPQPTGPVQPVDTLESMTPEHQRPPQPTEPVQPVEHRHYSHSSYTTGSLQPLECNQQPQVSEPSQPLHQRNNVVIIDAMAVVQSMGKPSWVRVGRDLASHFIKVIDTKARNANEVHVVFDRYDVPNALKERTRQKRQGLKRSIVYNIVADAVIDKVAMKDLSSCNENKQALATFFASELIECKKDSRTTYVVTSKEEWRPTAYQFSI